MSDLEKMLLDLGLESGVIADPVDDAMPADQLVHEEVYAAQETLSGQMDHADKAAYISDQLHDLAARADDLAGEDQAYARNAVSVESLHREFCTIMGANGLSFRAASFESEVSDVGRLTALAKDARRFSEVTAGHRAKLLDYTSEGTIFKWLRRDEQRVYNAKATLTRAEKILQTKIPQLQHGVVIKHNGLARFLTVSGIPVNNLKAAVAQEASWLNSAHQAAVKLLAEIHAAADATARGQTAKLPVVDTAALSTGPGGLLGNHTVNEDLKRFDEFSVDFGHLGNAVGVTVLSKIGWTIVGIGAAIAIGSTFGAPLAGAIGGAMGGFKSPLGVGSALAVKDGVTHYHKNVNTSALTSVAGAHDMLGIIDTVRGFDKYVKFTLDGDALDAAVKGATQVNAPFGKDLDKVVTQLTRLVDAIYEQAIYDMVMMAQLSEEAAKHAN